MICIRVGDVSDVAAARRQAVVMSEAAGFDESAAGRVALIATELATNLIKHGRGGDILVHHGDALAAPALHILSLDRGPGMTSVQQCLNDGYSTSGSPGTGLGAIRRQAHDFDIVSQPDVGTAIYVRAEAGRLPSGETSYPRLYGAVCLPKPGEEANGDAWSVAESQAGRTLMVVDGLGHGIAAAEAAHAAVRVFRERTELPLTSLLTAIHEALRPTRGAAVAVARIEPQRHQLLFAGIGNVAGAILSGTSVRRTVSRNGTAGHQLHRIQQYEYSFAPGDHFVMHSDGLVSSWSVERYPGLLSRHPLLIAGVLFRDFRRQRDDITVLVAVRDVP